VRLHVPMKARVIRNVVLRSSPDKRDDNIMFTILIGSLVSVVDGPVCGKYDGGAFQYWKVTYKDQLHGQVSGWLAEGDAKLYYLAP
jgi:hypothetical protein